MSFKGSFLTTVGLGVIGGGVVVISYSYTGIPCSMSRGGIVEGGGIAPQSLWNKPSGTDPEHRSEKKLVEQREERRSTKGAQAL